MTHNEHQNLAERTLISTPDNEYAEINNYEQGKRLIQSCALLQFDKIVRDGRAVALWAISGRVWVEHDVTGDYRLRPTSVSTRDYLQTEWS